MAEIALEHISKRYGDGFEAVKDMNLDVADGEFMILVGPSGCGKSTALRMVAGLEDITDGELKIGGQVVNDKTPKERDIAMVFQNYALYPHMTVRDNMGFALQARQGPPGRDQRRRSSEAARILDLEEHLDRKPANALRRSAAAGRDGEGDRAQPERVLDGRAALQPRREAPRADAHRDLADPAAARHDHDLRHPRPDRGADARRPDRGDALRACCSRSEPPQELYNYPTNLFVAGFIGSPSMNFLPVELDADTIKLPIGTVPIPDVLRARLEAGPGGGRGGVIAGLRPEDFEDATLVGDRSSGITFSAKIDVLESMGSEFYAYFVVESERITAKELEELAQEAGAADLPQEGDGEQVVARLEAASGVRQGQDAQLWFNTEHLHLFDPGSGKTLLAPPAGNGAGPGATSSGQPQAGQSQPAPPEQAGPPPGTSGSGPVQQPG